MIGRLFPITLFQKGSYVAEKSPAHQNVSLRAPFLKDCPTPPFHCSLGVVAPRRGVPPGLRKWHGADQAQGRGQVTVGAGTAPWPSTAPAEALWPRGHGCPLLGGGRWRPGSASPGLPTTSSLLGKDAKGNMRPLRARLLAVTLTFASYAVVATRTIDRVRRSIPSGPVSDRPAAPRKASEWCDRWRSRC